MIYRDSQCEVLRQALIDLGLGVLPPEPGTDSRWPVYTDYEPGEPDNCVTLYDTTPSLDGRFMLGDQYEHHGIQLRIRSDDVVGGKRMANQLAQAIDTGLALRQVTISPKDAPTITYTIVATSRTSGVIALPPQNSTNVFTVNAVMAYHD